MIWRKNPTSCTWYTHSEATYIVYLSFQEWTFFCKLLLPGEKFSWVYFYVQACVAFELLTTSVLSTSVLSTSVLSTVISTKSWNKPNNSRFLIQKAKQRHQSSKIYTKYKLIFKTGARRKICQLCGCPKYDCIGQHHHLCYQLQHVRYSATTTRALVFYE